MAKAKFYSLITTDFLSRKQRVLKNYLENLLKDDQVILKVGKDDNGRTETLTVVNGDEYLELNQNGLAICDVNRNNGLYEYKVQCFYDTSNIGSDSGSESKRYFIYSRHTDLNGFDADNNFKSDFLFLDEEGKPDKSKNVPQKSIFESLRGRVNIYNNILNETL